MGGTEQETLHFVWEGREVITLQRTSKQNLKRDRNQLSEQGEVCVQAIEGHGLYTRVPQAGHQSGGGGAGENSKGQGMGSLECHLRELRFCPDANAKPAEDSQQM